MHGLLESALFIGFGVLAVWIDFSYPRLRPDSLLRAAIHVGVSYCVFALFPAVLGVVRPQPYLAVALLFPILTYLLLSWIWLLTQIVRMLGGTPRGGLPVSNES